VAPASLHLRRAYAQAGGAREGLGALTSPLILVSGATGYIASRLIPRLLDAGYRVRALARHPLQLKGRAWFKRVEVIHADAASPSTLKRAFDGVDTAYYLIHNMSRGRDYNAIELDAARNFAQAAEQAGVQHIIYLGGLADPEGQIAPHMRSRIETGKVLRTGKAPVTEFRAGVIAGSGSISFEMIRFMTELFPVVPGPSWLKNKSQPIAIQNVIDYLIAALENKNGQGKVFEIGGPAVTTYAELMLRYARVRGLNRRMLLLPILPVWFMAFGVDLMTPVPYPIAYALIEGLSADSIVNHPEALDIFPEIKLIAYDAAVKDALEKTNPLYIERVWEDGTPGIKSLKHEGCFILHASPTIPQEERLGMRGKRHNIFGNLWIEHKPADLSSTLFFSPRGLMGFLYWFLFFPFHWFRFRGLMQRTAERNQSP